MEVRKGKREMKERRDGEREREVLKKQGGKKKGGKIQTNNFFIITTEHLQYISTLIQAKTPYYRNCFGVQFMLDVIRCFYSNGVATPSTSSSVNDVVPLSSSDVLTVRGALLGIIKLYLMNDARRDEVTSIVRFITACQDPVIVSY